MAESFFEIHLRLATKEFFGAMTAKSTGKIARLHNFPADIVY